jgi:hypothetical protein
MLHSDPIYKKIKKEVIRKYGDTLIRNSYTFILLNRFLLMECLPELVFSYVTYIDNDDVH